MQSSAHDEAHAPPTQNGAAAGQAIAMPHAGHPSVTTHVSTAWSVHRVAPGSQLAGQSVRTSVTRATTSSPRTGVTCVRPSATGTPSWSPATVKACASPAQASGTCSINSGPTARVTGAAPSSVTTSASTFTPAAMVTSSRIEVGAELHAAAIRHSHGRTVVRKLARGRMAREVGSGRPRGE